MRKTAYQKIQDIANDNYGVVTVELCKENGVTPEALRQLARRRPELMHSARGVYVLIDDTNDDIDYVQTQYVEVAAIGGKNAFLYGDTVLAMLDLARVVPNQDKVAVSRVYKKKIVGNVIRKYYRPKHDDEVTTYKGLPAQNLKYAFTCAVAAKPDDLMFGAYDALNRRLITVEDYRYVEKDLLGKHANAIQI